MSVLPDFSAPSYASFGDEFESIAPAAGAPNPMADKKAAHPSRGPPTGLPPVDLAAIDPFSEAVFPVPQTPPRIKPRHGHNAQPAQSPTAKKRCAQAGCLNDRFARGYCAFHLTELTGQAAAGGGAAQPTPTTKIRAIHHLWSKHIDINKETHENVCTWSFIRGDDAHRIVLRDHTFRGERVVTINNKTVFDDVLEPGSWKLDATIGRSFKSSVNVKLLVMPHPKGYDYDCFIDELPFDEAHQMFLSKLSGTSVQQRIELSEASSGSAGVEHLRQLQLNDSLYVKQNWSESLDREKTSLAGIKSKVNWHFTIKGTKHSVILEYGSLSGKKKILLDANVIYEKKPSILSANKHKRFSFKFNVNGVECEVTAAKVKQSKRTHASRSSLSLLCRCSELLFSAWFVLCLLFVCSFRMLVPFLSTRVAKFVLSYSTSSLTVCHSISADSPRVTSLEGTSRSIRRSAQRVRQHHRDQ